MISRNDIRAALARGYCSEDNKSKVVDVALIEAMCDEVMEAINTALENAYNIENPKD